MVLQPLWKVTNMLHIYRGVKVILQNSSVRKHANMDVFNRSFLTLISPIDLGLVIVTRKIKGKVLVHDGYEQLTEKAATDRSAQNIYKESYVCLKA